MPKGERGRKSLASGLRISRRGNSSSSSSLSSSFSSPETSRNRRSRPEPQITQSRRNAPIVREPTHDPNNPNDVSNQVMVYSDKDGDWIEITATFVSDLGENWISKGLLARLDPDRVPEMKRKEYGHLGLRMVMFLGSFKLKWTEKGNLKTKIAECRIVRDESFELYLKGDLLSLASPPHQVKSKSSPEPIEPPLSNPPQQPPASIPNDSQAIGCFDGLTKVLEENSPQSQKADEWMELLRTSVHKHIKKPPEYLRDSPAVRIAVLDTGIDKKHPFIKGALRTERIIAAKSFVKGDESVDDAFGHGTYVASLLLKVALDAKLYVARIATGEDIPEDHSIGNAIRWAISQDVDIITMSFGLSKDQNDMKAAVLEAHSKNILMFAAASNKGSNFPVTYPAKYGEVICIFSTDGFGKNSDYNPTQMDNAGYHFATLGEGVKSAWPVHLQGGSGPERRMTGTSFATPVAAGVAACVLEFALMNQMREECYKRLRHQERMQEVFAKLLANLAYELHYIHPWKLFKTDRSEGMILTLIESLLEG